jgi:hypothetical protein
MFWTGVATWVAMASIGFMWTIDKFAEWLIDSTRFKSYVIGYLASRSKRLTDDDNANA